MSTRLRSTLLTAALALALGACDDDEDAMTPPDPTTFEVTLENVTPGYDFSASGVFDTPVGAGAPGPIFPGGAYEFDVPAAPGARLSFATMFVQSNDWFYSPDGGGIELFDAMDMPVSGDVTDQLFLYDAGSEEDEEPGIGPNQAPRQAGADTGPADDDTTVRLAADDWGNIPATSDVIRVTLESLDATTFRVRIENVSDASTLTSSDAMTRPVPLAPGIWVVHSGDDPLFTVGEDERGEGLAAIAEDGDAAELGANVEGRTGIVGPISPGAWAVHVDPAVIFSDGDADRGEGLEAIAEDGSGAELAGSLASGNGVASAGAFDTPVGGGGAAPAFPGESYRFEVTAVPGDRLSFATMYVQSNDLFFAPDEQGIDLFPAGTALDADVTAQILLWDAGTEVNERPGVGPNQAPRQSGPDTGTDEGGVVREVDDGYDYPAVGDVVRITVRPVG